MGIALLSLVPAALLSDVVLPAAPGLVLFCIGAITVVQCIAAIVFYDHAAVFGERTYLYIAAGCEFAALMGVVWALTSADLLATGQPALGNAAVGVFVRLSLAAVYCLCLGLSAVVYRSDHPHYPREHSVEHGRPADLVVRTAAGVAAVVVVWVGGLILFADQLPPLTPQGAARAAYPTSWWLVIGLTVLSILLVLPSYLTNSLLHTWVLTALVLLSTAIVCGVLTVERYTVTWYATYVLLLLGSGTLLLLSLRGLRATELHRRSALVRLAATADAASEVLTRKAATDPLTGLTNRSHFFAELKSRLAHPDLRAGRRMAVVVVDCDRFKAVNDRWGHTAGDDVLRELAVRMHGHTRSTDLVSRLGGDEFGLALTVTGDDESIAARLDTLAAELARPVQHEDILLRVACSVGFATAPDGGTDAHELYRRADQAMYEAKRANLGRALAHSPSMSAQAHHAMQVQADAVRSLDEHRLTLAYQPILDLRRGGVWGYEALLRMVLPDGTTAPAEEFLDALMTGGREHAVGTTLLDQLARDLPGITAQRGAHVSFNLSAAELTDRPLVERILHGDLAAYAGRLVVEITEETLSVPGVTGVLAQLQDAGVTVALDDFGTGRSNLALLVQARPGVIKVDREFTACLSEHGAAVMRSAVSLAHGLHSVVVAEGVDTVEQESALPRLGVQLGQGYSLGRPLAPVRPAL